MSLVQSHQGRSAYASDYAHGPFRLFVAVACRLGTSSDRIEALLDTASEWCVLDSRVALSLGYDLDPLSSSMVMLSRFGAISGRLERIPLSFVATEGTELTLEATWFVSRDWPGPTVIGWKGCLERMRFGLDPSDESFYFAEL
ncbi:MAG TPA: hypothetical protein VK689_07060 [Armatimonadota bacterium]|nr:hypothetical protein [Armatimonadota bacterium]